MKRDQKPIPLIQLITRERERCSSSLTCSLAPKRRSAKAVLTCRFRLADHRLHLLIFTTNNFTVPTTNKKKKNIDFQFFKNALGDTTASLVLDYGAMSIYYLYVSLALLYTVVFQLFCCYSAIENRWGKLSQFIWHVCFGQAENSA